jgi:AraC-like DNA-binding protein
MDALSAVLKSVRLEGAVFLNAEFSAPWCVRGEAGMALYKGRLAPFEHMVFFHFVVDGRCKVRLNDTGQVIEAVGGDLVLFPQDDRHLMGSDLQITPLGGEGGADSGEVANEDFIQLRHGGGGATTHFVCGYLLCNRSMSHSLFDALPRMLRIPIGNGPAAGLLRELLQAGVRESLDTRPGAESSLAKLAELMFVEALRRYAQTLPAEQKGWLAGVRDAQIGRALALLHAQPNRAWTVDDLAREVALSRSALAQRFAALVGESTMQYLIRWRLALAAQALRVGRDAIARIAEGHGYESEAAFNRAFKREFGMPPAAWRKAATIPVDVNAKRRGAATA